MIDCLVSLVTTETDFPVLKEVPNPKFPKAEKTELKKSLLERFEVLNDLEKELLKSL